MLDDYLQQLVEEGDLDSQGRITLDASKARQKLADSRFSLSSEALLAVIAASLLGGARQVKVAFLRGGWTLSSDARPPEPDDLAHLMRDMFRNEQPAVWKELALAFNSLYPKFCSSLEFVSGQRRGWFEAGEWKVQPIPVAEPGWVLQLQRQTTLRDWWKWLTRRFARAGDLQILQARTRWSPSPVLFGENGQWRSSYDLDPPQLPGGALATIYLQSPIAGLDLPEFAGSQDLYCHHRVTRARTTLRCAILPGDPRASQLLLVYRGLTLAKYQLVGQVVRFHGVINTDSLDLDATRQHIVQNQRLRQRTETARQWVLEGTAAWVRQLDPGKVQGDMLAFLKELLNRINLSSNHKPLLDALDPMPLVTLGDGSSTSLGELRASLVRFPALHYGLVRELHDRPVLHPSGNLKKLSRILKVPMLDVTPWVKQASAKVPDFAGPIFERFLLRGKNWEANILLYLDGHVENRLVLRRSGKLLWVEHEALFPTPTRFQISLEGSFDGSLEVAQKQIIEELKAAILAKVEDWIEHLQAQARNGSKASIEHFASLLCLWMRGAPTERKKPSASHLAYPYVRFESTTGPIRSLAELLADGQFIAKLNVNDPLHKLSEWL